MCLDITANDKRMAKNAHTYIRGYTHTKGRKEGGGGLKREEGLEGGEERGY